MPIAKIILLAEQRQQCVCTLIGLGYADFFRATMNPAERFIGDGNLAKTAAALQFLQSEKFIARGEVLS